MPSFSSTTASRTNRRGVATMVSLSTMLIRLLALVITPLTLRAQVEGEGFEALDVRAVEDLDPHDLGRLTRREVERPRGGDVVDVAGGEATAVMSSVE